MTPIQLFQLPPALASTVLNFLQHPSREADPDRLTASLPAAWAPPLSPAAEQALSQEWQLDAERDLPLLDLRQPLHRLALLPRALLGQLARQLGLLDQGRRLRRVILRSEREALAGQVSRGEWAWLLEPQRPVAAQALAEPAWPELAAWLDTLGWALLTQAAASLPGGLAQRLTLKLRPVTLNPAPLDTEQALHRVLDHYPRCVAELAPDWEAGWNACLPDHDTARSVLP